MNSTIKGLTLALCALTTTQRAQAHSSGMDLTASVSALFANDADHNGTSRSASRSAGWLLTYRYSFLSWAGIETNYGHSTDVQHIKDSMGPAAIHTEVHEVTAALVFRYPMSGTITPFALVGMGLLQFSPNSGDNNLSPQSQNKTDAVYGIGVDYAFAPRWRLRAQYRGLLGQAPSFINQRFRTNTYLHIAEPTIGISYSF